MTRDEPRTWATRDVTRVPRQRTYARAMRANPTDAERKLWLNLRKRLEPCGTHFRRQAQIGRFIADFASHKMKPVIEVDGGQHASRALNDAERTEVFQKHGYRVLRYWNNDVLANVDGVLEDIQRAIATTLTPDPSPRGGGERTAGM